MKKIIQFAIAFLLVGHLGAQTITVGSTTTQLNTSQRAAVASFWPDGSAGAINHGGTIYMFAPSTEPGTVAVTLPSLATWSSGLSVVNGSAGNISLGGSGAFDQNYAGGGAVYDDTAGGSGKYWHLYHGEQWFGGSGSVFYAALGLAYSSNLSGPWTKLGEVISPQSARVNGGTDCQAETGVGTLLPVSGTYLYAYYTDTSTGCTGGVQIAVARASIAAVRAAVVAGTPFTSGAGTLFMKYTGSGTWNGDGVTDLANPQNGGGAFTQITSDSVFGNAAYIPNVRYDSVSNSYIMVYIAGSSTSQINAQTSTDGVTWGNQQTLVSGGGGFGSTTQIYYPTLFNTGAGDPQTLGTNFSVFYVKPFNPPSTGWAASTVISTALSIPGGGSCTPTAASLSPSDVLTALNSVSGCTTATVTLPSGTSSWTSALSYTSPAGLTSLTIQGQTVVTCTGTPGQSSYSCTSADNSIIQDAYNSSSSPIVLGMGGSAASCTLFRITGLTIKGGSGGAAHDNGIMQINGSCNNFRIDHVNFNMTTYSPIISPLPVRIFGQTQGVADHNIQTATSAQITSMINVWGATAGDSIGFGDGPWANPTGFGTGAFMFVESNYMNGGYLEDCGNGGAFVARYNTIINGGPISAVIHSHGTYTENGRGRSCRAYEAYHNYIVGPSGTNDDAVFGSTGGPSMVWGNTLVSGYNWFAAVGSSRNDGSHAETNTPNGWGYCGTSSINPNTGNPNGTGSGWDGNTPSTTGYPCLDGLGRGQGQALNGQNFPNALNSVTSSIAFPAEKLEPIYYFENTIQNGASYIRIGSISDQFNRDVFYDCGSLNSSCTGGFTGAFGTGSGLLSARPSTCTPGPGGTFGSSPQGGSDGTFYFATDVSPNTNGGVGRGFACTATNTWTDIYDPAIYPNPLVGGGGSTITGVTASCAPTSITTLQTSTCTPTVTGTGSFSSAVTWTATNGTVNSGGLYTPNSSGAPFTGVVTATSVQNSSFSGSANVSVTAPPPSLTTIQGATVAAHVQ